MTVTVCGAPNFASSNSFSGTLAANQLSSYDFNGNGLYGTVSRNASTGGVTISFTLSDGTKGVIYAGPAPSSTSLVGAHTVVYLPTTSTLFVISQTGSVVAEYYGPSLGIAYSFINVQGYIDSSDTLYIAYNDGSYQIAIGKLTLSNSATNGTYTGTLIESPSGERQPISVATWITNTEVMSRAASPARHYRTYPPEIPAANDTGSALTPGRTGGR